MKKTQAWLALLLLLGAAAAPAARAQEPQARTGGQREVADSAYAVLSELDRIADQMRQGELSPRERPEAQTAAAVRSLAAAAGRRRLARPHPSLGPVWDLRLEATEVQPVGRGQLRVPAKLYLATAADEQVQVTMVFRKREDGEWVLLNAQGLAQGLQRLEQRIAQGEGR